MHFQGRQLNKNGVCLASEKWSILKGKNLLPVGANSFLLEKTPFQKVLDMQESKQEVALLKLAENQPGVSNPLKHR